MKKLLLLLSLLVFVYMPNVFGTHNKGGIITYSYAGDVAHPYKYHITVTTFSNTYTTSADRCELTVIINGVDSILLPRINGLSTLCPPKHDGEDLNTLLGVTYYTNTKKNIYDTIYNFAGPGNYLLSVTDPNRTAGICNVDNGNSVNIPFALQARLVINSLLTANNGVQYNAVPVISDTIGVITHYNPLAMDSDSDSLYYALDTPYLAPNVHVPNYVYPAYSHSFSINSLTGTVTWDNPPMICVYVFDIKVSEFRNVSGTYFFIGNTMEEAWNVVSPYVSTDEINLNKHSLNLFPNPASDFINFSIEDKKEKENYTLEITNSLGQLIKHITFFENETVKLSTENFTSGIYFYTLTSENSYPEKGKFTVINGAY